MRILPVIASLMVFFSPSAFADSITFDDDGFVAGDIVSVVHSDADPSTDILVMGLNPSFGAGTNAAMIYDSDCPIACSGDDPDLGTPNEDFAGPGIGAGGESGSDFENDVALSKVLIVSEDLVSGDPDDLGLSGGKITFDFSNFGSVRVSDLIFMDSDGPQRPVVTFFDPLDNGVGVANLPITGDNGVGLYSEGLDPTNPGDDNVSVGGVATMVVDFDGSGAIDNIVFIPQLSCTPGFWKNHAGEGRGRFGRGSEGENLWPTDCEGAISPDTDFDTIFTSPPFNGTLLQALKSRGPGSELIRHAVAAYLNACTLDYTFDLTQVVSIVESGDGETLADLNDIMDCPL